jgi:hypothetical protein
MLCIPFAILSRLMLCCACGRGTWYWTSLMGGGRAGSTLAGLGQNYKNLQLAPRVPGGCRWARRAIGPFTPKIQTQGERDNFGGRFSGATIGWARFSIAMVHCWQGEVINNPSRGGEPVPRPRKGNPLGGPVRGIFISSPSHWPVSSTVESRESGVEVLEVGWPGRGTHNRDPGASGPMKREGDATRQKPGREQAGVMA